MLWSKRGSIPENVGVLQSPTPQDKDWKAEVCEPRLIAATDKNSTVPQCSGASPTPTEPSFSASASLWPLQGYLSAKLSFPAFASRKSQVRQKSLREIK